MPYIAPENRPRYDAVIDKLPVMESLGDLNYLMTKLAIRFALQRATTYANLSSIVGQFECAKLEYIRRVLNPYEDGKISLNGDVYPDGLVTMRFTKSRG